MASLTNGAALGFVRDRCVSLQRLGELIDLRGNIGRIWLSLFGNEGSNKIRQEKGTITTCLKKYARRQLK